MRIGLTGGLGFIGTNFIKYMNDKHPEDYIQIFDACTYAHNKFNPAENPRALMRRGDIRSKLELEDWITSFNCDYLVHLAAESAVDKSIVDPRDFITTNIIGTFNVLEVCKKHSIPVIIMSTDEVYGSTLEGECFTEDSKFNPSSPYSASKASADLLAQSYIKSYGLTNITIIRCCNVFGPYQHDEKLIPITVKCIKEDRPIPIYGDGLAKRDWLFVDDLSDAFCRIIKEDNPDNHGIYNISTKSSWTRYSSEMTNLQLIKLIASLMNKKPIIQFVDDRPAHDLRYACDSNKFSRTFSWSPESVLNSNKFIETLEKVVKYYVT
jgi:dTDP-glucose 4,6-dehydratase